MIEIVVFIIGIVAYLLLGLFITGETVIAKPGISKRHKWVIFFLWPLCISIAVSNALYKYFIKVMND